MAEEIPPILNSLVAFLTSCRIRTGLVLPPIGRLSRRDPQVPLDRLELTTAMSPDDELVFFVTYSNIEGAHHALFRGADINTASGHPILTAVVNSDLEMVKFLIENGARLNFPEKLDPEDGTWSGLISQAIVSGNIEILLALLNGGASPNVIDPEASPPLTKAILNSQDEMVDLLLERGANVNDTNGTILTAAALMDILPLVAELLDRGAEVNRGNLTAIGAAVFRQNIELINFLLEHGADIRAGNPSALQTAMENDNGDILTLLLDAQPEPIAP